MVLTAAAANAARHFNQGKRLMVQLGFERAVWICRSAMLAAVVLPSAAAAQEAAVTPPADSKWVKVCSEEPTSKKQLCQVIQQLTADTGQFIASVNIQQLEGEPKILFAAAVRLPTTGVLVAPGMRTQIDTGKQYEVKYTICFPEVCYADMQIDDAFVKAMKAGGQLILIALTQQAQQAKPISIPLTLVGFTKAFDGEGIDPLAAKAMRDDLAQSLKAHADEARQKLLDQQQKATGAPQ